MPPVVFFDVDRTLMDTATAVRRAAEVFLGDQRESFDMGLMELVALWDRLADVHFERYLSGEITFHENRRACVVDLYRHIGRELADAEADAEVARYFRHFEASYCLFPDTLPCLDALAHLTLGVVSNGESAVQRAKIERPGIAHRFDPILISAELGVAKPDPDIFLEACRRVGRKPSDCFFIGDKLDVDARAARDAGLRGVWINRVGAKEPAPGVPVVTGLDAFVDMVEAG